MEKNYSIWDENKEISGSEQFLLDWAEIPQFQRQEADLKPDKCDLDAFKRLANIRNNLSSFLESHKNNLIICGQNLGCGKTEWALKLMLTHIENNAPRLKFVDENDVSKLFNIGVFCKTVPFLVEMKQFGSNLDSLTTYKKLKTAELAVFDDISAVPMSNYDYNILYALVESRVWAGLPSIFTTNITSLKELEKEVGPRLAERIWKTSVIIELKGEGYRGV